MLEQKACGSYDSRTVVQEDIEGRSTGPREAQLQPFDRPPHVDGSPKDWGRRGDCVPSATNEVHNEPCGGHLSLVPLRC